MRRIPFFLLIIILLRGCNSQSVSLRNYEITQLVTPSTPEPSNSTFIQVPIFTPTVASHPIRIGDPTVHPKILPQKATSTSPDEILTDAAYIGIGQRARGQFALQNVPMVNQENFTSCGEAAVAMAWNYKHPGHSLDIGTVEKAGLTLGVYFPALSAKPTGYLGTSPSGMEAIGSSVAARYETNAPTTGNIEMDNGSAFARLEGKGLLYSQLSAGNPIIIEVSDNTGNPSRTFNNSHYVIITGMDFDTGSVTYNDPLVNLSMSGKYSGYGRSSDWSQVWYSWFNNKDVNPGEGGHPGRGWYMIVH
jgi:uncharacterized protein YvpB